VSTEPSDLIGTTSWSTEQQQPLCFDIVSRFPVPTVGRNEVSWRRRCHGHAVTDTRPLANPLASNCTGVHACRFILIDKCFHLSPKEVVHDKPYITGYWQLISDNCRWIERVGVVLVKTEALRRVLSRQVYGQ